jgi:hypothetical protein
MYQLFTDKTELFECNIKLQGASLTNSVARIVVESQDISLLFTGTIDSQGKCKIPIRKLSGLLKENTTGNLKLEVIADDAYFTPWSSEFSVLASKQITVEVKSQDAAIIMEAAKPAVTVTSVKNEVAAPIKEHVVKLLKMLIKEDIKLSNLSIKKDKLNNIIATYLQENTVTEIQTSKIIDGLLRHLPK